MSHSNGLFHRRCGGTVEEDRNRTPYEYRPNDNNTVVELHYPIICGRCGAEVLGDAEIELWFDGVKIHS